MRDRSFVEKIQGQYKSGMRVCDIARKYNQTTSNISRWCRKLSSPSTVTANSSRQELDRHYWYKYDQINLGKLTLNTAKILLATFYWCEGCKYPGTNKIEFVSSDENMQKTFITLLRSAFRKEIDESKFRVMLQLHTTHDTNKQITYWSSLLSIPKAQFTKPHLTVKTGSRYRLNYNGTCNLRYNDYRLLLRIMGVYDQLSNKIQAQLI